jgi:nicotinate phosphoribosyltransferase
VGRDDSTGLLTDHYELTMLDAAIRGGVADRPAVFETFARRLPQGRRYGVVAGLGRVIDAVERFRFGPSEIDFLARRGFLNDETLDYLRDYRFTGEMDAYREGELYLPNSPVLTVTAPFGEAVILETLILSILNFDSAVASGAARMVGAAGGRSLLEFGSRRTHEDAAVAAARAAYVVGFDATSNLEAGRRYDIPTSGTVAHAFIMVHGDEQDAFAAQVDAAGAGTTILIDTYDIPTGIRRAVTAAGPELGAIRIDSGDLAFETTRARALLDELGATGTRIVVSGDLDEYRVAELDDTPADAFGIGTQLVVGSGHPTAGFVYKLVARGEAPGDRPDIPEAKASADKATVGGRKRATRLLDDGIGTGEAVTDWYESVPPEGRPLQVSVMRDGEVVHDPSLEDIRAHHRAVMAELPEEARRLDDGAPVWELARS